MLLNSRYIKTEQKTPGGHAPAKLDDLQSKIRSSDFEELKSHIESVEKVKLRTLQRLMLLFAPPNLRA